MFQSKQLQIHKPTVMPTESVDELIEQLKGIRLQEGRVLEKLCQARKREKEAQEPKQSTRYEKGDRVCVNNAIRTPPGHDTNTGNRDSTVLHTKLTSNKETKVFIRTDNGYKTWRLAKTLDRL